MSDKVQQHRRPAEGDAMLGFAGSSMGFFAVVWSLLCMVSGVLVTDSMLRDSRASPMADIEPMGDAHAGGEARLRR